MKAQFFILLIYLNSLNCSNTTILNCNELNPNTNTCSKCQDKYFPLFHNLFCLPCDDKDYGQIGCGGNCDSSQYENDRFVYCENNSCKEGFIGLNGLCFNCSVESPGCKNCLAPEIVTTDGQLDYKFTCLECLSDEYKLEEFGTCLKCQMDNCLKCRFNGSNQECFECESNYYLSSDKTCKRCHEYVDINGGYCRVCSDNLTDLESAECFCYPSYILNENNTCSYCIEGCSKFIYDKDNIPYCIDCTSGYVLYEKKCLSCPDGCYSCYLDNYNQTICTSCYSDYVLSNGKCEFCCYGCNKCIIEENNNTSCLECDYNYAFLPNNTCTYCGDIEYLGNGCERCQFNTIKK